MMGMFLETLSSHESQISSIMLQMATEKHQLIPRWVKQQSKGSGTKQPKLKENAENCIHANNREIYIMTMY